MTKYSLTLRKTSGVKNSKSAMATAKIYISYLNWLKTKFDTSCTVDYCFELVHLPKNKFNFHLHALITTDKHIDLKTFTRKKGFHIFIEPTKNVKAWSSYLKKDNWSLEKVIQYIDDCSNQNHESEDDTSDTNDIIPKYKLFDS